MSSLEAQSCRVNKQMDESITTWHNCLCIEIESFVNIMIMKVAVLTLLLCTQIGFKNVYNVLCAQAFAMHALKGLKFELYMTKVEIRAQFCLIIRKSRLYKKIFC